MHIKITKQAGLFLSLVATFGFSFGAESSLSNLKITLSNDQRRFAAVVVPLVLVGGTYLYGQYGPSSLPSIPYEAKCGVATILSMPVLHSLLGRVTSEDKLQLYYTVLEQFEKSKFTKKNNQEKINAIVGMEDQAEAASALTGFIHSEFGENPRIAAEKHLLDLKGVVEKARKAFKASDLKTDNPDMFKKLGQNKEQLKKLIQILRNSEQHEPTKKNYDKQQRTKIKIDRVSFMSQIRALVPLFVQPVTIVCLTLLDMVFLKLGIKSKYL